MPWDAKIDARVSRNAVLLAFYENDFADNVGIGFDDWTRGEVVDGQVAIVPPPPARFGRDVIARKHVMT